MVDMAPAMHPKEHLARLLAAADADRISETIELLILALDMRGGNSDLEPNGDEMDGTGAEDDHWIGSRCNGSDAPGCPISDPDWSIEDEAGNGVGDRSYAEWHSLEPRRRRTGNLDGKPTDPRRGYLDEDDEDDDPAEESDSDRCAAGDDMVASGPVERVLKSRHPAQENIGDADDGERPYISVTLNRALAANDA